MSQPRTNENPILAGKPGKPSRAEGGSLLGNIATTVGDLALEIEIPFLAKRGLDSGHYYASEALRNPNLQKKAIDFTLDKDRLVLQKVGSEMLDQISTKVRSNRRYKTDRPDLDGSGFDIHSAIGKLPHTKTGLDVTGP